MQGDFNARTGELQEFVCDDNEQYFDLPDGYLADSHNTRYSNDHKIDCRGKALIDQCTALGLRFLNGRIVGDCPGKKTCYKYNGSSTVDYVITEAFLGAFATAKLAI